MFRSIFLAILSLAASLVAAHAAGGKIALVVGVSKYEHAPSLPNTINDAKDMSAALKRLGFEVETVLDPSRSALEAAVRRYGDRSTSAEVSLFHYSGHALEIGGHNWLVPVTANLNVERDLRFEAVDLSTILEQTETARVSIIFLDACRDSPFIRRLMGTRRDVSSRGLASVEMNARGMLVAFATAPGQVALDGTRKNSPFTAALLKHIEIPGLEIKSVMARVTKDVIDETKGKQRPWQNSSLEGDFYLLPPVAPTTPNVQAPGPNLEALFWDSIKSSHNAADFKAYLVNFPKGLFVELAQNRLAALEQEAATKPSIATADKVAATSPSSLRNQLIARLSALSVAGGEAEARARDYEAGRHPKAIAVAIKANHTWRATGRVSQEAAINSALEGCQIYYGEPCTLVAAGDKVESAPVREMPRTQYSGRFEPERVPSTDGSLLRRADAVAYRSISGPKAAAFHPWGLGWLFIVTGAANQFEAEQQVLAQCNDDPRRKAERQEGPCFLYAVGDRVVLPQRLTKPRASPKTITEALDYLGVPRYSYAYLDEKAHKAIAVAPESRGTYRRSGASSVAIAEQRALEGCQLQYHTHCVLLASDDSLKAPDLWKAERQDMPRLKYNDVYKPENVPLFSGTEEALNAYVSLAAPKAMVIRPNGARVRTATGASLVEAQLNALAACNDDAGSMPCFVYAVNDRVVLDQRRTEPLR